jgi:tRNA threonylcarbamoyl adenosine modification protein (Sua5/YciO/YrdC/YwlC family)
VLISSSIELEYLAEEKSGLADILIQKYWLSKNKKPLTLIFKKNKRIKNFINPGTATIAVRLDPLEIIKKIIKKCGPIVSTSATISGSDYSPENITQIPEEIIKKVDIILDLGQDLSGIASTIIDVTGQVFLPVREGQICIDEISNFLNFKKQNPAFLRNQNK